MRARLVFFHADSRTGGALPGFYRGETPATPDEYRRLLFELKISGVTGIALVGFGDAELEHETRVLGLDLFRAEASVTGDVYRLFPHGSDEVWGELRSLGGEAPLEYESGVRK